MVIAKIQTPTQSFRPLAAIVDDAESVGEGDEVLKRSIGYRAKSFASTEVFLFPGRLRETERRILDFKTPAMGGMASPGLRESIRAPK